MTLPDQPEPTEGGRTLRKFDPPPFLKAQGIPTPVRTPLGHYRTESLFLERWRPMESERPIYTLYMEDREDPKVPGTKLLSFARRYVELGDITGYKAARDLLGSWAHWLKLSKCPWFREYLDEWNQEIAASVRSRGFDAFVREADKGDLKAAEWLVNFTPQGPTPKAGRGRPSKGDIAKAAREAADASNNLSEDARRLGLNA